MNVVGYTRVSTEKQRDEATIETQVELIQRYCDRKSFNLIGIFRDDGVSGESTHLHERPQGRLLLKDAEKGRFKAVVVYHPDRLGRTPLINETIFQRLYKEKGILIFDVEDGTDLTTDIGRFMFTLKSALASMERSRTLKRSMDATLRYAEIGVWLGGIVPYGYRVEGKKKDARLRLSTELIPGFEFSEVEVVEMIYRWLAEGVSCPVIARRLNALQVPTSYARDEREVSRCEPMPYGNEVTHKRKRKTANVWTGGRIRNMTVSTTYKGISQWGKRQKPKRSHEELRPIIERAVPAIVDAETWRLARAALTKNRMISRRNSKRQYLLRGKIKCGCCGLTYSGSVSRGPKAATLSKECRHPSYEIRDGVILRPYYCCTAKSNFRGIFGAKQERCPSRTVSSQTIEEAVWADVEAFLRNPGAVLEEIQEELAQGNDGAGRLEKDLSLLECMHAETQGQKDKLVGLHLKDIIDEEDLDAQLKIVDKNRTDLKQRIDEIKSELAKLDNQQLQCQTTRELLQRLNGVLDRELTFEVKREIIEALVDKIRVDTVMDGKKKLASVTVFYRFEKPSTNRAPLVLTETGMDVRADSCSADLRASVRAGAATATKPAPAPRHKSAGRGFPARFWTESTSISRCPDCRARN